MVLLILLNEIKFLECLRFFFSRLVLTKDANLILEIMDKFSINYFETNKNDSKFVEIMKSSDKIYLLLSTILALNTMFTRKDIKIKNVIKKDEFIKMNVDISKDFIEKLYDEIKKSPILMSDDYNEAMYKKLASLVKEDEVEDQTTNNEIKEGTTNTNKDIHLSKDGSNNSLSDDELKNSLGKKEFNLQSNLKNYTEEDEKILKTPYKFYRISGGNKSALKEFVLSDELDKIYYDKKKFFITKNLIDVYNGINHSHNSNINKFLKNNPSEEQFREYFISLIFENEQVDLFSDDLNSAMRWFKAIKSFILTKNKKDIETEEYSKDIKSIRTNINLIWSKLLNKWNLYGKYLLITLIERNTYIHNEEKQINFILNFNEKVSINNIVNFIKAINIKKLSKDKELDYKEFIKLYCLGLPNKIRNKIWQILIGNPSGIYTNTYEFVKKQISKINFNSLDANHTNKSYCKDNLSNTIIIDILKIKDAFSKEESIKDIDKNLLMTQLYNITRSFYILRADIPYNKSIITIAYLFFIIFKSEENTFFNVVNLICSYALKHFIADENEIKNNCSLFNSLLGKYLDKIEKHFSKLEIIPQLYLVPWFEELFTSTFNIKILSKIFDYYLLNGEIVLYQTGLAIIKCFEEELLNLTINEVFKTLQKFPESEVEMELFSNIHFFSCIKKEFYDWKLENNLATQKSELFEIILSAKK